MSHFNGGRLTFNLQNNENDADFVSDPHFYPPNVLNFFDVLQTRNDQQSIEQNMHRDRCSLFSENPVHNILNLQQDAGNFYTSPSGPGAMNFSDEFISFPQSDDNDLMGQNLFATFLQPPPPPPESGISAELSAEAGPSFGNKIDASSPVPGSRTSVAEPLLEMGFSIKHVKKAIDATGKLKSTCNIFQLS